jgi:hypothetical protein
MGGAVSSIVKPITSAFGGGGSSQAQQTAPSAPVVSQSSATDATQTISKRRRGKSPTILTDALGNAGTATTESKTLLGG